MTERDELYLVHIRDAIARIVNYTSGGHEAFLQSTLVQDAVLRNLQTLAESTQHLSMKARSEHPEVEWAKVAAFRNVLVHDYLGIDFDIVWGVIQRDLPRLDRAVLHLLSQVPPED